MGDEHTKAVEKRKEETAVEQFTSDKQQEVSEPLSPKSDTSASSKSDSSSRYGKDQSTEKRMPGGPSSPTLPWTYLGKSQEGGLDQEDLVISPKSAKSISDKS